MSGSAGGGAITAEEFEAVMVVLIEQAEMIADLRHRLEGIEGDAGRAAPSARELQELIDTWETRVSAVERRAFTNYYLRPEAADVSGLEGDRPGRRPALGRQQGHQ